jgi:hypothetical protein
MSPMTRSIIPNFTDIDFIQPPAFPFSAASSKNIRPLPLQRQVQNSLLNSRIWTKLSTDGQYGVGRHRKILADQKKSTILLA